jgi:guanylate kinase
VSAARLGAPVAASGQLVVVAGPSGVGKGTILAQLRRRFPDVVYSVSATTRSPRPGEQDGVHYHFIDDAQFDQLIATGGLLEWAQYASTRYGTPRQPVLDALAQGKTVLLEIELNGARQVRHTYPQARQVFIAPPSWDELERRLRGRGAETSAQIEQRLEAARVEMAAASEFDRVIVNDDLNQAVDELVNFLGLAKGIDSGHHD